ncbi:MAG: hypothetical protein ACIAXF_09340 [Phycisphaerales bacterium JB063]
MLRTSRLKIVSHRGKAIGGAVVCGVLWSVVPAGLGVGSVYAQPGEAASAQDRHAAQRAYEAGLQLHREGAFESAIEKYHEAIMLDPSQQRTYAALTDAQVSGAYNRLLLALRAADEGNLSAARGHIERAYELDGGEARIAAAAKSFGPIDEALSTDQQQAFAQAQTLADERSWRLARQGFESLIESAPFYLPARAAKQRATHFEQRANELNDQGVALMQQHRLRPALESLAAATAIWPYHPDAAATAEQVQAQIDQAQQLAQRAANAAAAGELELALETARSATAIDSTHAQARGIIRDAERGLADRYTAHGKAKLEAEDYTAARADFARAFTYVGYYPEARRGMAQAYLAQGASLRAEGRPGAALLAYLAGQPHHRAAVQPSLEQTERELLAGMDVSLTIAVPGHTPAIGVDSQSLSAELATLPLPTYMHRTAQDQARFAVEVRINDTDVTLRQTRNTQSVFNSTSGYATGYTQWEKRGTLVCTVTVTDTASGDVVEQWNASRWVVYTDRQQYVVGATWRRSYWTLPSDDEVEARLARDMVDEVWPGIRSAVTLERARALRDQAQSPDAGLTPEQSLERRVAAVLLAGQINEREGRAAIRELADEFAGQ